MRNIHLKHTYSKKSLCYSGFSSQPHIPGHVDPFLGSGLGHGGAHGGAHGGGHGDAHAGGHGLIPRVRQVEVPWLHNNKIRISKQQFILSS